MRCNWHCCAKHLMLYNSYICFLKQSLGKGKCIRALSKLEQQWNCSSSILLLSYSLPKYSLIFLHRSSSWGWYSGLLLKVRLSFVTWDVKASAVVVHLGRKCSLGRSALPFTHRPKSIIELQLIIYNGGLYVQKALMFPKLLRCLPCESQWNRR